MDQKTTLARRGVLVRLPKRNVCYFCKEYIMPGQAYQFANIDPKAVTIRCLFTHVTCGDEHAKRGEGLESGVTDEQILKFRKGMEELENRNREVS